MQGRDMQGRDVQRQLKARGLKQKALAAHLQISEDSVSRLLNNKRDMELAEAEKIREFLQASDIRVGPEKIPVYGYASGSDGDRVSLAEDRVMDWIEAPIGGFAAGLDSAFRVTGESMEPRLFAGETVFVAYDVPPARGQDCVVVLKDGAGLVKTYVGRKDGYLIVKQWHPEQELRYRWDEVRGIHAVRARI